MKQSNARREHQQRPTVQQDVPSGGAPVTTKAVLAKTARLLVIDGAGGDCQHGEGRHDREQRHEVKHGSLPDRPAHQTGHAEVVRVTFDPGVITYEQLLEVFWAMHDPTQVDRQGPDIGDQYRSVIFTETPEQEVQAMASKARAQARFSRPIATDIEPLAAFYPAEDYHQRYYEGNGHTPYCHVFPADLVASLGLTSAKAG